MKTAPNTTKRELPFLFYQDMEIKRGNLETLKEIFNQIRLLGDKFRDIGIPFNREAFIKTMNEGSTWLFDILYKQATEMFDKMSDLVKASMVDKEKLLEHIRPIEPIRTMIIQKLGYLNLPATEIPFDTKDNPVITDDLKNFCNEISKKYCKTEEELNLYLAVEEFCKAANHVEALLAKYEHPLMLHDSFAESLCILNDESFEEKGYDTLEINPYIFDDLKQNKERIKFIQENRAIHYVPFVNDHSKGVPAAQFRPKFTKDDIAAIEGNPPAGYKSKNSNGNRWDGVKE